MPVHAGILPTLPPFAITCYNLIMQTSSLTEYTKRTFFEMMKDVATSIPGHVIAFDPATQHAQIQIGIVRKDVNGVEFDPAPLIEVPVYFAGGKFSIEYQIDPLDEGAICFSQRCVDGWKNTGGIAKNPVMRFHDMNDAFFLPGIRSQPNVLTSFENNGIRLRNADASQYVWLKNDGTIIIKTPGAVTIESSSLNHNGVNIGDDHKHLPGTYNINGTPVTANSGDPII